MTSQAALNCTLRFESLFEFVPFSVFGVLLFVSFGEKLIVLMLLQLFKRGRVADDAAAVRLYDIFVDGFLIEIFVC